ELDLPRLEKEEPDRERVRRAFLELEFHNLLRELDRVAEPAAAAETSYVRVADAAGVREAAAALGSAERLAVHALGSGADPLRADLVGLAIADRAGRAWYFPLAHRPPQVARDAEGNPTLALDEAAEGTSPANLPPLDDPAMAELRARLESDTPNVGHDLKYTLQLMRGAGVRLGGVDPEAGAVRATSRAAASSADPPLARSSSTDAPLARSSSEATMTQDSEPAARSFDTAIASYCLDPARRDRSLDLLALERFATELVSLTALTGGGRSATPIAEIEPERALEHAAQHAELALRLADLQAEDLERARMRRLFAEVEMPLLPVLASMERAGIAIDLAFFERLGARLHRELRLVEEEIRKVAGEEVNLRSVPQLRELLFDTLALPVVKRTKTGASTDESVLEQLAALGHEIPRLILEHRELDKLDGTYVGKLPQLVNPATGRIHTQFNQTIAATGRLSSSDPNLQNIPIRSALGREIRKGFVPAAGFRFVGADYSQIELRVLAHLSGDPAFVEAFRADRDIHRETAARIFGVEPERVTGAMREQAKTINFATIYGQGPVALAAQLGISRGEARKFIEGYFERFAGVAAYLEEMKEMARERGYVETLIGRRRYIPEIRSKNPGIRGYGERTATNSPIQGTAADLIKLSMIRLHRRLRAESGARMLLQVHDELLFEVPEEEVESVGALVREEMEGAIELEVPLRVDLGVGDTWFETKFG
ncbi:MAG: DNA polymerase I, partial [Solirubrobacterales bacterium]